VHIWDSKTPLTNAETSPARFVFIRSWIGLQRAADKSRREYATYLFEMLEWAAVNGAIEALMPEDLKDIAG
jgi:hypothetical protein